MQQAISYRSAWATPPISAGRTAEAGTMEAAVSENAVTVIGRSGCCMCHVAKQLLLGHGVNPAVFEVDEKDEAAAIEDLTRIAGVNGGGGGGKLTPVEFPVIFVGGKMFGGLEKVMGAHISGDLVPILREAGALWL
ncbi:glutaredoxin-C9-like [Punica granatum]|uniref:Glutaredoxin domain-containing protein n=2 Tax=Punica granatum TaxID=22663 RepID=A0A218Y2X5_PUNGR|nr:glutaredoxin-C9-like [Punica granatum]OWM91181.1 hypothetical protein CDL15_Pgr000124 [Punica granatum]PKI72848.1 hypothetical protein CRG98_006773 [Punica granatum]